MFSTPASCRKTAGKSAASDNFKKSACAQQTEIQICAATQYTQPKLAIVSQPANPSRSHHELVNSCYCESIVHFRAAIGRRISDHRHRLFGVRCADDRRLVEGVHQ